MNMQGKVLSFGELLLRICPDIEQDWIEQHQLPFYVGGAELNVATALALWNVPSSYLSAIPPNAICEGIDSYLQGRNIDTSSMQWIGERLGIYYLPKGKDLKNAGVIYDRANSSFANLKVGSIDWDEIFTDVKWFHFSAICPAISQDIADLCLEAVAKAQEKGIFVSLDLNYRAKLWKYGKAPKEIMPQIARYCNLIMGIKQGAKFKNKTDDGHPIYVFASNKGTYTWPRNFHRKYSEVLKKAGIPHIKLHSLRHTFATRLIEEGEDIRVVQELLRHANIKTTASIYAHVTPKAQKKAANKMDNLLRKRLS